MTDAILTIPCVQVQQLTQVRHTHPNGTITVSAGALSTVFVWVMTELGLEIDATTAAAFVTIFSSTAAFIGKVGLKGMFDFIWRGGGDE